MNRLMLLVAIPAFATASAFAADNDAAQVARGKYLVTTAACNDCHTPWHLGPSGPEPDMSRMLSGHPEDMLITQPATQSGPWTLAATPTNTAWSGPWGVSFTANLTPDDPHRTSPRARPPDPAADADRDVPQLHR